MRRCTRIESNLSRRTVLTSGAAGIVGLLAGCGGFSDVAENRTGGRDNLGDGGSGSEFEEIDRSEFEGTTLAWYFRKPWVGPPGTSKTARWVTWFGTGAFPGIGVPTAGYSRPGAAYDMTMAPELWGPWVNRAIRTGDRHYGLYENVEITPDDLTIHVREDANWSNGDPVLGRDAVPVTLAARLATGRSFEAVAEEGPTAPIEAITGVEFDGKGARFLSDGGWFDEFLEQDLWALIARTTTDGGRGGVWEHTRIEPYEAWFDRLIDIWDRARAGEIAPWSPDFDLRGKLEAAMPAAPEDSANTNDVPPSDTWPAYFHNPENCVVTGAFEPVRVEPTLIVLEQNPEFYAADDVEVDTVLFPVADDKVTDVHWAALVADRRDYLRGRQPAHRVDSAPDGIEQRLVPSPGGGLALGWNHWTPPFDSPAVRQALAYAIDTETIATNAHPMRYDPVTVPGGGAFRARKLLGETFIKETLTSYDHDPDAAAERLRQAGYTRDDGTWVEDGTPVEVPIMAPSSSDVVASTVRAQLEEFGLTPRAVEYVRSGERPAAWPARIGTGLALRAVGRLYMTLVETEQRAHRFGVVPRKQIAAASYDDSRLPSGELDAFTVEAPPVDDPDGPLESWHAPRLARECVTAGSHAEYVEALRRLAWLSNWNLPVLPIANEYSQHFFDARNWTWPDLDLPAFDGVGVAELQPEDLVALGKVQPN